MARVLADGAGHTYPGADTPAVHEVTIEVANGELLVLVGPSGSGKTTIPSTIAGLATVDPGRFLIGERDVTKIAPKQRDVVMVFQQLRAVSPDDCRREHGLRAEDGPGLEEGARPAESTEAARLLDLEPYLNRTPEGALGRAAAARRHGSGDRPRATGVLDG